MRVQPFCFHVFFPRNAGKYVSELVIPSIFKLFVLVETPWVSLFNQTTSFSPKNFQKDSYVIFKISKENSQREQSIIPCPQYKTSRQKASLAYQYNCLECMLKEVIHKRRYSCSFACKFWGCWFEPFKFKNFPPSMELRFAHDKMSSLRKRIVKL
jgi:hypothetical protein